MSADPLFGWDLTFKTVEKDVKRKSDVLVAFIHWNLTKRGFRSIGIGDERTLTGEEEKTELLPSGWNDKDNYTLRYLLEEKLYILHGVSSDDNLIINLLRSEDLTVSNVAVNIDDYIKAMKGSIDKLIPNHKELMFNLKRDLIETVTERPTTTVQTQTTRDNTNDRRLENDPLRVPPRPLPCVNPDNHDLWELPSAQLPNVGRSDLDPFAPGAGGMIFNPFGPRRDVENPGLGIPGGLPRGAVPPGARFDPFGPPGAGPMPGRRPPPDADHFPPPGFNDHMFISAIFLCEAHVFRVCGEFCWLFTAASVQFLFNVYGCGAGHFFCGDIDGVPLGQRGVLPGPTQIKCGRVSESVASTRGTHAAGSAPRHPLHTLYVAHTPTASLNPNPAADWSISSLSVAGVQPKRNRNKPTYVTRLIPY